jgi:hypothetical protein
MTDNDEDDGEIIICLGGAKLTDTHLASTIHCIDEEIFSWLEERNKMKFSQPRALRTRW